MEAIFMKYLKLLVHYLAQSGCSSCKLSILKQRQLHVTHVFHNKYLIVSVPMALVVNFTNTVIKCADYEIIAKLKTNSVYWGHA